MFSAARPAGRLAGRPDPPVKILFLSHYYPPEVNAPANRVHEHARVWAARGHEVTVLTGVPNHPRGELFPGYENRLFQEEWIEGVHVVRTWMYVTANEGFLKRTANYVLFAVLAVLTSLRLPRPDVVVGTSPQFFCGLAGAAVALLKRRPFVAEIRDLWPDSIVQLGQLESGPLLRLLEGLESLLYKSAEGIVVVTEAFKSHIRERGIPEERIELVYNGIDTARFRPLPRDDARLEAHGLAGRFTVAYVGTLGLAHGLVGVIEAAERLPDVSFVFIGDGADRARLEGEVAERGLSNVSFLGLVPRDEVPGWLASIDVLLVMLRDLPVFETVIPSKMFEYLAQERPLLMSAPRRAECRRLIDEAGAGLTIDADDSAQLAAAIDEIRDHPEDAARRAKAGREWVLEHFRREQLALRMLAFLERVAH